MSNDLRTAAQHALEALEEFCELQTMLRPGERRDALRAALAEPEPAAPTVVEPDAYGYASRLAVAIWEKHYKDESPQWKPLDDLLGVLTQIDNMTTGLTRQQPEPAAPLKRGTTGICTRVVCECEQNRLGPECVYLRPRMPTQGQLSALEALTADAEALGLYEAAPTAVEPVAWSTFDGEGGYEYRSYEGNENYRDEYIKRNGDRYAAWVQPLYTTTPRAALTDAEIDAACGPCHDSDLARGFRAEFIKRFRAVYERLHILAASGGPRNE